MGFFLLFFWVCVREREREIERGRKRENSPWKHKAIGKRRIGYKSKRGGHAEVDLHTKLGFSPEWRETKKEEEDREREREREREKNKMDRERGECGEGERGREGNGAPYTTLSSCSLWSYRLPRKVNVHASFHDCRWLQKISTPWTPPPPYIPLSLFYF